MAQVAPSDFISLKKLNYGLQNDFGFAIVSAEDLEFEQNSRKCPSVVELFIQSLVTDRRTALRDAKCTLRIFYSSG